MDLNFDLEFWSSRNQVSEIKIKKCENILIFDEEKKSEEKFRMFDYLVVEYFQYLVVYFMSNCNIYRFAY